MIRYVNSVVNQLAQEKYALMAQLNNIKDQYMALSAANETLKQTVQQSARPNDRAKSHLSNGT
jgi:hypothetical protein